MSGELDLLQEKRDSLFARWKEESTDINRKIALLKHGVEEGCILHGEDGETMMVTKIDHRYYPDTDDMAIYGVVSTQKKIFMGEIESGYWKRKEVESND